MTYTKQSVLWQTHNKLIKSYIVYTKTQKENVSNGRNWKGNDGMVLG
jgi:hypothetical protein